MFTSSLGGTAYTCRNNPCASPVYSGAYFACLRKSLCTAVSCFGFVQPMWMYARCCRIVFSLMTFLSAIAPHACRTIAAAGGDKSSAPGSTRPPKSIRHSGGGSLPISTNSSGLSPLCLSSNRSGPLRQSSTGTGALRQSGNGSGSLRQSEAGAAPLPPAALHSLPSAPPLPVALQWGDGFVEIRRTGTVLRAPSLTPPAQVATAAQVFDSAHATPRFS